MGFLTSMGYISHSTDFNLWFDNLLDQYKSILKTKTKKKVQFPHTHNSHHERIHATVNIMIEFVIANCS